MYDNHFSPVHIETLPPLHVACYRVIGDAPEDEAFQYIAGWIGAQRLAHTAGMRAFGFDVPLGDAERAQGKRGYEVWVTVPAGVEPGAGVAIRDVPGGTYAVLRITDPFTQAFQVIPAGWKRLAEWVRSSADYGQGEGQGLEEQIKGDDNQLYLDLYLPVTPAPRKRELLARNHVDLRGRLRVVGYDLGLQAGDPANPERIAAFWREAGQDGRLEALAALPGLVHPGTLLGLCDWSRATGSWHFSYIIGVEVAELGEAPAGMVSLERPGGLYAIFPVSGDIQAAWPSAHAAVQALGYHPRSSDGAYTEFESFDERWQDKREMDIYIPIAS